MNRCAYNLLILAHVQFWALIIINNMNSIQKRKTKRWSLKIQVNHFYLQKIIDEHDFICRESVLNNVLYVKVIDNNTEPYYQILFDKNWRTCGEVSLNCTKPRIIITAKLYTYTVNSVYCGHRLLWESA